MSCSLSDKAKILYHFWLSGNHWLSQWSQMSSKGTIVPSCFRGFAAQSSYRLWR